MAQPSLIRLNLSPKDGQLDLEVVYLEDRCQYLTIVSRIASVA